MDLISTFLQIDMQNLFYAARAKGQKIDFEKVWQVFNERENEYLIDAIVYMIRNTDVDSSKFEKKLEQIGYKLRIKNTIKVIKNRKPIYLHSNHDANIIIDCLDKINLFNKWILMSGDGDFADLCAYLRKKGKKIELWSFQDSYSSTLDPYIDNLHFIENGLFYKKPNVTVFGFRGDREL